MQLLLELGVSNLLQDIRIPGFINLECFLAMWANYFVHRDFFSLTVSVVILGLLMRRVRLGLSFIGQI
jgi:hypothetical protein